MQSLYIAVYVRACLCMSLASYQSPALQGGAFGSSAHHAAHLIPAITRMRLVFRTESRTGARPAGPSGWHIGPSPWPWRAISACARSAADPNAAPGPRYCPPVSPWANQDPPGPRHGPPTVLYRKIGRHGHVHIVIITGTIPVSARAHGHGGD